MKKAILISFIILFCSLPLFSSCGNSGDEIPEWAWGADSIKDPNTDILALGWTRVSSLGTLPDYLQVYKSPDQLEGKKAIAYIAIADMSKATFNVLGDKSGYKTPDDFYKEENASIIMNAGYFWDGSSLSLLCRGGQVLCPNNQIEWRSNGTVLYYPTRAAFGLMKDGTFSADWVYTTNDATYAYSSPSPNKSGETPQAAPSATYPTAGVKWQPQLAIGGGPVLIKNGEIKNTFVEELFDADSGIGPEINNPRSAIGTINNKKLLFFVCEGRNMTPGVAGLTLADEAKIMKNLGCTDAINLDGGGSSCMLINGKQTILPSDGSQRKVVTGISLK